MVCKVRKRFPIFVDCDEETEIVDNIDLGYNPSPTNGVITNTVGNNATISAVNETNAGLMTPALLTELNSKISVIEVSNVQDGDNIEHGLDGTFLIQFIDGLQVRQGFYAEYVDNNNSTFRTPVSGLFSGYLLCIKLF